MFFVIAKLCCTSRLSPEANRTVAVRLSGWILEPVSYDYYTPTHTDMLYTPRLDFFFYTYTYIFLILILTLFSP